jgi:hypothetical protein
VNDSQHNVAVRIAQGAALPHQESYFARVVAS